MSSYHAIKDTLRRGWNTWHSGSVLCHVQATDGLAIRLGLKSYARRSSLLSAQIGRTDEGLEQVRPGAHAYDGSYTSLTLSWEDVTLEVETAQDGDDWVALIRGDCTSVKPALLIVQLGYLWNRPGHVQMSEQGLRAEGPGGRTCLYSTAAGRNEPYVDVLGPYFALDVGGDIGLSSGRKRTLAEIKEAVTHQRRCYEASLSAHGDLRDTVAALRSVVAWNMLYDPAEDRFLLPPHRIWCAQRGGGYAIYAWDSYFGAYLASLECRELAYAVVYGITQEAEQPGFVPNVCFATGRRSLDRSQPPVGALMVREIYRNYRARWLVADVFDTLLRWNEWWLENRLDGNLLCWGSRPFEPQVGDALESEQPGTRAGAALESGLDNSPMYDEAGFDRERCLMQLHDVGLNSLYAADCLALADLADIVGQADAAETLRKRGRNWQKRLQSLWNEQRGIFCNHHTDSGRFSERISPCNFYPLLAGSARPDQAEMMVNQHLLNEREFWGPWVLPSIARDDAAFVDQHYWRGRIWAPLNFLMYLGLRNYKLPAVRRSLAEKSNELLLRDWRENGTVNENYHAVSGRGGDNADSNSFYSWGALLGLPALMEAGLLTGPEQPLSESGV